MMIHKTFIETDPGSVARVTFTLPDSIWADKIHLAIVFAIIYALVGNLGVGSGTWPRWLIFGAVHGVVVIVMVPVMMRMRPRPSEIESGPITMIGLIIGHMLYSLVVAVI
jgi:hypothetical protein